MRYPISLGKKMSMPENPTSLPAHDDKKYYPSLYLEWDDDYELPDSGVMMVRFKKRSQTDRTTDKGTQQAVELDITEIKDVEPDKTEEKENPGRALDKYREEVTGEKE